MIDSQHQPHPPSRHPQKDACIALEVRDPMLLAATLRRTSAVLAAVPALEGFVAEVCSLCFREGLPFCPRCEVWGGGRRLEGKMQF
jgi:hypothetical protein